MSDEFLRIPPHSLEAEQSLIGLLLNSNDAHDSVAWLRPEAFYAHGHRLLWEAIGSLIDTGKPADFVTVCEAMAGDIDKVGGHAYVGELAQNAPSARNAMRYAEMVRDKAALRDVIQKATDIASKGFESQEPRELVEEASAAFLSIQLDRKPSEMVSFGMAAVQAVEWLDNPKKGIDTDFVDVDAIVGGLMPGDLIIIGGRPSMGKTALAMNIAEHVARDRQVAVFSLEMTSRKVAARSIRYHEALLGGRDEAVDHVSSLKLHIDDSPGISVGHMRLRLRRLQRKHGLALVVIDYLQLVSGRGENRTQEISEVSRGLKALAKDFDVPVVAVAQLNRGVEQRGDHRPMLSDLRESGQVEQDADIIAFVYRDEYYKPDTEWKNISEVIVRKNRDGATGTAYLTFLPQFTRFKNLDRALPVITAPRARIAQFDDFKSRAAGE